VATWFSVAKLREVQDPFTSNIWGKGLLTEDEVVQAVAEGRLNGTPFSTDLLDEWTHLMHVERVAYLVVNPSDKPIEVDVGIPHLGCHVDWPVQDGNHRLAAAICRGDKKIRVEASGACDEIKKFKFREPRRT
jgi:hypothetical protein